MVGRLILKKNSILKKKTVFGFLKTRTKRVLKCTTNCMLCIGQIEWPRTLKFGMRVIEEIQDRLTKGFFEIRCLQNPWKVFKKKKKHLWWRWSLKNIPIIYDLKVPKTYFEIWFLQIIFQKFWFGGSDFILKICPHPWGLRCPWYFFKSTFYS